MAQSGQVSLGSYRFFIGIDVGTHGSGWAHSAAADGYEVKTNEYWPGNPGMPAPKTRTALLYNRSDISVPVAWGWEAVTRYAELTEEELSDLILLTEFKLHLMPEDFKGLKPLPSGFTVRKVMGDFLRCLMGHVNSTLKPHYSGTFSPSKARFCLTVPAGLPQAGMATMRQAALDADIIPTLQSPALVLATEPEAAALLVKQRKYLAGLDSSMQRLMVIDMGGGTVDMTLHEVTMKGGEPVLQEMTHRICLPEGATRVDARLEAHMATALGGDTWADWAADPAHASELMDFKYKELEACKCSFGSSSTGTKPVQVAFPYSLVIATDDVTCTALEEAGNRLMISYGDMAGFFKPSLEAIAAEAKAMLQRAGGADTIVL